MRGRVEVDGIAVHETGEDLRFFRIAILRYADPEQRGMARISSLWWTSPSSRVKNGETMPIDRSSAFLSSDEYPPNVIGDRSTTRSLHTSARVTTPAPSRVAQTPGVLIQQSKQPLQYAMKTSRSSMRSTLQPDAPRVEIDGRLDRREPFISCERAVQKKSSHG